MPDLILYSDAKAKNDRWAVCGPDGQPVWFGKFYKDHTYVGHQASGELAAALKAVWFAQHVRRTLQLPMISLRLWVDAQWLTYRTGRKSGRLWERATGYDINFTCLHMPGLDNPADVYTICDGHMNYDESKFQYLLDLSAGVLATEAASGKHFHAVGDV